MARDAVIPALDRAGRIAWPDLFLSLGAIVVLVVLGFAAPSGIHPLFYFGLIFLGGAAFPC
ncbi:hypothetical protein [Amycolatopsis panacis]|uniref:hypothetical protein n=1 Tax=Amycolatopsis panacis TaxID=2340917 RepID=UPI001F41E1A8|nr:hypothetical protein [Amycolatopsis panacis]